jgi:hypothetical protein
VAASCANDRVVRIDSGSGVIVVTKKYGQKIIYFCRPCAEYRLKTHPHWLAAKRRCFTYRTPSKAPAFADLKPAFIEYDDHPHE